MFITTSCDYSEGTAAFHIYNNSRFEVTEIWVPSVSGMAAFKDRLAPGESCTLEAGWFESDTTSMQIAFNMNGEEYGCREQGEAMTDPRRFKPYKRIHNGDTITVKIYDDTWEW
jgi:hypothetical protein